MLQRSGGSAGPRRLQRRRRERRSNDGGGSAPAAAAASRPAIASRACQAVADIVRTTLGPRAMLKMLLDANGGIVLTNDGAAAAVCCHAAAVLLLTLTTLVRELMVADSMLQHAAATAAHAASTQPTHAPPSTTQLAACLPAAPGNAILREIDVSHPAAKSIIELSRTQDEEVGAAAARNWPCPEQLLAAVREAGQAWRARSTAAAPRSLLLQLPWVTLPWVITQAALPLSHCMLLGLCRWATAPPA